MVLRILTGQQIMLIEDQQQDTAYTYFKTQYHGAQKNNLLFQDQAMN